VPALSTPDDAGDPVGLDPAILWHGAAYRLPQAPRQAMPAPSASASPTLAGAPAVAPVAAARQRYGLHYTRRLHSAPAPQPQPKVPPTPASQAAAPQAPEPPARDSFPDGFTAATDAVVWFHHSGL
jgi:hypothetical protein